jgi:hypothetical protein
MRISEGNRLSQDKFAGLSLLCWLKPIQAREIGSLDQLFVVYFVQVDLTPSSVEEIVGSICYDPTA